MFRRNFTLTAAILLSVASFPAIAQTRNRIPLSQLEFMFSEMRKNTRWNVDGPLLWGYFFIDTSLERLNRLGAHLQKDGFQLVKLHRLSDSAILYQLHVEKVEVQTPDSLYARNADLYKLAAEFGVASYDGMDVGPVTSVAK